MQGGSPGILEFINSNQANLGSVKQKILSMYQKWYRKALRMLNLVDRGSAAEFERLYREAETTYKMTIVDCINRLDRPGERPGFSPEDYFQRKFLDAFTIQKSIVDSVDLNTIPKVTREKVLERKRVFISHGKHPEVRDIVCEFLESLGILYKVVVKEPSLGKTIHRKVREGMKECTHLLAIATPDDKTAEGYQPRQNVIQEIGLAEKMYAGRIIILKEKTVILSSNIRSLGYVEFAIEHVEKCFVDLAKELKGFGIL